MKNYLNILSKEFIQYFGAYLEGDSWKSLESSHRKYRSVLENRFIDW